MTKYVSITIIAVLIIGMTCVVNASTTETQNKEDVIDTIIKTINFKDVIRQDLITFANGLTEEEWKSFESDVGISRDKAHMVIDIAVDVFDKYLNEHMEKIYREIFEGLTINELKSENSSTAIAQRLVTMYQKLILYMGKHFSNEEVETIIINMVTDFNIKLSEIGL